jgi:hypothetical protein
VRALVSLRAGFLGVLLGVPATALADDDPCADAVVDPIATPVRDVYLDAQRSACMRTELSAGVIAHALIDTPGFYGTLGGDLALGGRMVVAHRHELSAQLRVVDYSFVQNAVNTIDNTGFGPLVLGAATGAQIGDGARGALALQVELPYTRDQMDTFRTSAQLSGLVTGRLTPSLVLHTRLGALGMHASSVAGSTQRLALRAGADLVWQVSARFAVQGGSEVAAGWHGGFDHVLVRAGVHWQVGHTAWRLRTGVGLPVGGAERTNAVVDLAVVHGL